MKIEDMVCTARGFVRPAFVNRATGRTIPFAKRHNQLSFMAAEAMAAAFGGDPSYIPAKVGFIYGSQESMPYESVITRDQSWEKLLEELDQGRGTSDIDIQVVGFSYGPTLGGEQPQPDPSSSSGSSGSDGAADGDAGDYNHLKSTGANAITFHAVSNSQDAGAAFDTGFIAGQYVYQAVLLGFNEGRHYVISRASLKDGDVYRPKPAGFEIALDWTILFK